MLILTRKKNEIIMIGDDIRVLVVEIRGERCRIGIDAPKDTPIYRQEIYDAIKKDEK